MAAQKKSRSSSNGSPVRATAQGAVALGPKVDDYSIADPSEIPDGADVLVDVPVVKVDEIDLKVEDLHAQVAVMAEVRELVQLSVGADARIGKVELKIEGVEAQALLKARLDNVSSILERVLTSLDRNPELLESIGQAVEEVSGGAGKVLEGIGRSRGGRR